VQLALSCSQPRGHGYVVSSNARPSLLALVVLLQYQTFIQAFWCFAQMSWSMCVSCVVCVCVCVCVCVYARACVCCVCCVCETVANCCDLYCSRVKRVHMQNARPIRPRAARRQRRPGGVACSRKPRPLPLSACISLWCGELSMRLNVLRVHATPTPLPLSQAEGLRGWGERAWRASCTAPWPRDPATQHAIV